MISPGLELSDLAQAKNLSDDFVFEIAEDVKLRTDRYVA